MKVNIELDLPAFLYYALTNEIERAKTDENVCIRIDTDTKENLLKLLLSTATDQIKTDKETQKHLI